MRLVVGLRNPEAEFDGTRHNIGAEAVMRVAARGDLKFKRARRGIRALVAQLGHGDDAAQLVLPNVAMNHSGQVVAPLMNYFDVTEDRLLVVHDDIDLPFAKLRVQFARGAGGHNGVTSVIGSLGSSEFWRLKIGVGRPPGAMDPAAYVLRRFTSKEVPSVGVLVEEAADAVEAFASEGPESARQQSGDQGPL
ncbi:MAG: aminoacyl-tRNA hydrolase [Acidimicrobiia bacterium]|nr:aminoacyl-tRNA hydrolase [Acidimicrobiia bacterium]